MLKRHKFTFPWMENDTLNEDSILN